MALDNTLDKTLDNTLDNALDKDTLEQLLQTVRRFVRERLLPLEAEVDAKDNIPPEIIAEMRELGLFGISIPQEYGGLGLNMREEVLVAQELGYTSPAFRSVFGTNIGIGSQGILIDGSEAQKQHYLPRMARGEIIGSFALTEPDVGSDAASVQMRAEREGDVYFLSGTKRYITNAPYADVFTVMARTGRPEDKGAGVTAFLVDSHLPGISLGKKDRKMGQRGAHTCDVNFDRVRVPKEAIIGGIEGRGFRTAMKVLNRGRLHISAVAVGSAKRLIDEALAFASERKQFGTAIGNFQLIQAMLADSQTEYYAAKCMVEATAKDFDTARDIRMQAASCKLFASEMVNKVADRALQIHGGAGYMADYAVERFYRDVRLLRIYEGTSQIQQLIIAKEMLKRY